MGKRKQLSMKDLPPKPKGRFNFDLDEEDFEAACEREMNNLMRIGVLSKPQNN